MNIIGKLISPNLHPNTLGIKENLIISTVEFDEISYENFQYVDIFNELIDREESIIPLGKKKKKL